VAVTATKPTSSDPVRVARSRVAIASRRFVKMLDPQRLADAQRDLNYAKLRKAIEVSAESEWPLEPEQRRELAGLLYPEGAPIPRRRKR